MNAKISAADSPQPIALVIGEPAGIGPEIAARVASKQWPRPLVLIGDRASFLRAAESLAVEVSPDVLRHFEDRPAASAPQPGQPAPRNAASVIAAIDAAIDGCLSGRFAAMVTGPVQKSSIAEAGYNFVGMTGHLAERTGAANVVMMLADDSLRVALVTTHLPLREVADALTPELLRRCITTTSEGLRRHFGIQAPRLAVLGLNPHAGEGGLLGLEELELITPVLDELRAGGGSVEGPFPADTAFIPGRIETFDAFIAMYHDQALPVLKARGLDTAVNMTLGLPFLRVAVDHGTALDIAGRGLASPGSLERALTIAMASAEAAGLRP